MVKGNEPVGKRNYTALVTGTAGFLGSFLSEGLITRGYKVIGIDNFFRGKKENIENLKLNINFEFHHLDLTRAKDLEQLENIIRHSGIDIVFHYAAVNGTRYFYDRPMEVLRVNTEATINLLNVLSNTDTVKKIVYASSSEVYGDPQEVPTPEEHPIMLRAHSDRDSYAAGKAIGEFYIRLFSQQRRISYLILRIFNCYGERMDTSEYGQVIPEFIRKILLESEFTIIGDGRQTRSFCYVSDNIRLSVTAAERVDNEILNVGSGEEVRIIDLARLLHELEGKEFRPRFLLGRPHDHMRRCPSIHKISSLIGDYPHLTLKEGLKKVLSYYKASLKSGSVKP